MDFKDVSSYIDMLIGLLQNAIKKAFTLYLSEVLELFKLYDGKQFKREYKKLNKKHYKNIQEMIEQSKVLTYIHTKLPSEFLISQMTDEEILSQFDDYDELLKHLDSDTDEFKLFQTILNHLNKIETELNGLVMTNEMNEVDESETEQAIKHIIQKYERYAQQLGDFESGKAQSQAKIDIDEENNKRFEIEKIWISQRDKHVRSTHVLLDGQKADDDGLFYSKPTQTKGLAPRMMVGVFAMKENLGCRCSVGFRVNGIELGQLDKENMSKEHLDIYEQTDFDNYQDWLEERKENIHPAYYEQLSKGILWDDKKAKIDKQFTVKNDAAKFKKMVENGFHKKKDGSWGY